MPGEEALAEVRQKFESVKTEIAQKEGVVQAELARLQKEFKVKTIDEGYKMLETMKADIAVKRETKDELIQTAADLLKKYRG